MQTNDIYSTTNNITIQFEMALIKQFLHYFYEKLLRSYNIYNVYLV